MLEISGRSYESQLLDRAVKAVENQAKIDEELLTEEQIAIKIRSTVSCILGCERSAVKLIDRVMRLYAAEKEHQEGINLKGFDRLGNKIFVMLEDILRHNDIDWMQVKVAFDYLNNYMGFALKYFLAPSDRLENILGVLVKRLEDSSFPNRFKDCAHMIYNNLGKVRWVIEQYVIGLDLIEDQRNSWRFP